jgi:uncharacterized protein (UPF0335 family)
MPDGSERDLGKIFDLDRSTLIKSMVQRMEECMRQAQAASDDLKAVVAECREAEFIVRDIDAMKTIARLRIKDKAAEAREKLEAMRRIGRAVGFDLFDWAGIA